MAIVQSEATMTTKQLTDEQAEVRCARCGRRRGNHGKMAESCMRMADGRVISGRFVAAEATDGKPSA